MPKIVGMAEALKYMYNETFLDEYTDTLRQVIPDFDSRGFRQLFRTREWDDLELKQRVAFLAKTTDSILPKDTTKKIARIRDIIRIAREKGARDQNFVYIFLCDIIGQIGLEEPDTAIQSIEWMTSFTSFEFAGRQLYADYPEKMLAQLPTWASHPDPNVRRYASEGCRPRLPWGLQLKAFVKDPTPILPVLEMLKDDPSEYVRKSVANNLNDISKDHPDLILDIIKRWQPNAPEKRIKLLRQAARTLLKKGNAQALSLFGNHEHVTFDVTGFSTDKTTLPIGASLSFAFTLRNTHHETALFRLEYAIYFVKANGQHSKKIFKISDINLKPGEKRSITKQHRFADLTTRKHYTGEHVLSVVINGKESAKCHFDLTPYRKS